MRSDLDPKTTRPVAAPERLLEGLRELPQDAAPPYDYSEFSRRYSRRRVRHAQLPLRSAAAALAVVVAGWVVTHRLGPIIGEVATIAPLPTMERTAVAAPTSAERWLAAQPRTRHRSGAHTDGGDRTGGPDRHRG